MNVLIAEDDPDMQKILGLYLRREGYQVDTVGDGAAAVDFLAEHPVDLVVLDWMMPVQNGLDTCREIRRLNIPVKILMLTAKGQNEDEVAGLSCGADDYLIKPFAFDELLARIKVIIRRKTESVSNVFTLADLTVNCDSHTVTRGGRNIQLASKEFAILEYMIRNQGIVLSKEKIEQHIWNYDYEGGSSVIKVYIRYLRKKIDDDFDVKLIHTVRNAGYVLRVEP